MASTSSPQREALSEEREALSEEREAALSADSHELERDNQSPEAEEDISDSERLMPQTDSGENGEAPNTNSSEAEDDLLSEIAQEFSNEATTGPNVSQWSRSVLL